jgi:hypothetical protein
VIVRAKSEKMAERATRSIRDTSRTGTLEFYSAGKVPVNRRMSCIL